MKLLVQWGLKFWTQNKASVSKDLLSAIPKTSFLSSWHHHGQQTQLRPKATPNGQSLFNSFHNIAQSSKFHSLRLNNNNKLHLDNLLKNNQNNHMQSTWLLKFSKPRSQRRSVAGLFIENYPPPESSRHPFVPRRMGGDGKRLPTQDKLYPLGFFHNIVSPTLFTAAVVFTLTRWANYCYDLRESEEKRLSIQWREQFNRALENSELKPDTLDKWITAKDTRQLAENVPIVLWKIQMLAEFLQSEEVAEQIALGMDDPAWLHQAENAPQIQIPSALQVYYDLVRDEMLPLRFGRHINDSDLPQMEASINANMAAADIQEVLGHFDKYDAAPWLFPIEAAIFYGPIIAMPLLYLASKFRTTWGFLHRLGAKSHLTKKSPHTLLTSVLVHKNLPHFLGVYTGLMTEGFYNLLQRRKNDANRDLSHEHTWAVFIGGQCFGGLASNFSRIFISRSLMPCWGGVPGFFALMGSYRVHSPDSPFFGYHSALNVMPSIFFIPGEDLKHQTYRVFLVALGFLAIFKINPDFKVPDYPIEWSRIRFTAFRKMAFWSFLLRFDYPAFAGGALFGILYTLYLEYAGKTQPTFTYYSPMTEFKDGLPATQDYIGWVDPPGPYEYNTLSWHYLRDFDGHRDPLVQKHDHHYRPTIPERYRKGPPLPIDTPVPPK